MLSKGPRQVPPCRKQHQRCVYKVAEARRTMTRSTPAISVEFPAPPLPVYRSGDREVSFRGHVQAYFEQLQDQICDGLAKTERQASFHEDRWYYDAGGGGRTRILQNGAVFEKAGVNFSAIEGSVPASIAAKMEVGTDPFFATGVSLVIHPL